MPIHQALALMRRRPVLMIVRKSHSDAGPSQHPSLRHPDNATGPPVWDESSLIRSDQSLPVRRQDMPARAGHRLQVLATCKYQRRSRNIMRASCRICSSAVTPSFVVMQDAAADRRVAVPGDASSPRVNCARASHRGGRCARGNARTDRGRDAAPHHWQPLTCRRIEIGSRGRDAAKPILPA